MGLFELIFIALSLSMDAFAVSVCKGLSLKTKSYTKALVIGLFFGSFQAVMPLIGFMLGEKLEYYVIEVNHWISLFVLSFIGGRMIYEAVSKNDYEFYYSIEKLSIKELIILSIATSLDALAVGVTFAVVGMDSAYILFSVSLIGAITLVFSFIGVVAGNSLGIKFKKRAEIFGGIVLILIGIKILLTHLGVINF